VIRERERVRKKERQKERDLGRVREMSRRTRAGEPGSFTRSKRTAARARGPQGLLCAAHEAQGVTPTRRARALVRGAATAGAAGRRRVPRVSPHSLRRPPPPHPLAGEPSPCGRCWPPTSGGEAFRRVTVNVRIARLGRWRLRPGQLGAHVTAADAEDVSAIEQREKESGKQERG
jgi:hypothetical protein